MKIDIIIPCKNPTKGLFLTIKSIYEIEEIKNIFIINDNSNIGNDIFERSTSYNKVILKKNLYKEGISGALNTGLYYSKSKLMGRIDSGDICIDKRRFRKIIEIFNKNKKIDLVCSGLIGSFNKKILPRIYFHSGIISPFSRIPHPTWVFKKESIKHPYEYKNLRFEDYTFILKNKFTIYAHNEIDIRYETLSKLNRLQEIKVSFFKSLFFCKYSNYDLIAIFIGILYLILRIIRLLISDRKIVF